jgi:transposase
VAAEVGCTTGTVIAWNNRFRAGGLDALRQPVRTGHPRSAG